MPELKPVVTISAARLFHLDLVPFKPYVYRGLGFDIYASEEADDDA